MTGGIYSEQRCPVCGGKFLDTGRALACPEHGTEATRLRVKFGKLHKRTRSYKEARHWLYLWRGEKTKGTFDAREYMATNPLGFSTLSDQWMNVKGNSLKPEGLRKYRQHQRRACDFFGDTPVSRVGHKELEQFIHSIDLASYTVKCQLDWCMEFLRWCHDNGDIPAVPKRPRWKWSMGKRKVIDKPTQAIILEYIYETQWERVPRACVAIELLCTYPMIRPGALREVQEKHIDLDAGTLTIPETADKQGQERVIQLLPRHVELIRSLPRGFGYFLRYDYPIKGRRVGQRLGKVYLYRRWMAACNDLGVSGVPLYPGTKHTTISDWGKKFSDARIREATGHMSDAMRRYLVLDQSDCVSLYQEALPKTGTVLALDSRRKSEANSK